MGLQSTWGPLVAWDFFLGGAGAGAYLMAVWLGWTDRRHGWLARTGIVLGPVLVALGALLLLMDLGEPLRFWRGYSRPGSSVMSVGVWLVSLFLVLGAVHLARQLRAWREGVVLGWLAGLNGVFALGVMLYPGLLVGVVKAVPFWNTPLWPVLFVVAGLSAGVAVLVGAAQLSRRSGGRPDAVEEAMGVLARAMAVLVGLEALGLLAVLVVASGSGLTAAASVAYLVSGGYAWAFWLGLVGLGLVVPLVWSVLAWSSRSGGGVGNLVPWGTVAAVCLLVGAVVLRYSVLAAGLARPVIP
ncbi:NrfD/PsrC family molybdoenzyme membrane anchor subunit [Carboxydochorda subterranea]|uniref:NrfD/PsrC family molybdoenzyme membrane anchor subunit n=1 Tax=Carboxydichorda subterranea TaxID=3109565 RepID=A0ABZ1BWL3_9FIRM|nr:NrfD/PsrC family molybdoenzyme membrane anchor subunit [Limnochorda sp. L945t]WRP16850.1 NrfD/PsrC family molybdoenzyme membrane anchor subunit [Limnochorda sp. L945t]